MTLLATIIGRGVAGSRPADPGAIGALYFSTDTEVLERWNGATWQTYTPAATASTESVQDIVGAMATAGTGITVTYDDGAGTLTIEATGGGLTQEQVEDAVAALIIGGAGITATYVDATPSLTLDADWVDPLTTKGDLVVRNATVPTRLPVGSDGQVPVARSADAEGIVWENRDITLNFSFPDAVAGDKAEAEVGFAATIVAVRIFSPVSGSAAFSVDKATYSAYDTFTNIDASAPPTLTTAKKSQDTTLTGWTTAVAAGDVLRVTLDSLTTTTALTLALTLRRA